MHTSSQHPDPSSALSNPSSTWRLAQSLQATQDWPFLQGLDQEAGRVPHPDPLCVPRSHPLGGTQVPSSMT